jgi:hypothetical protein
MDSEHFPAKCEAVRRKEMRPSKVEHFPAKCEAVRRKEMRPSKVVCAGRLERPLNAFSGQRLCRLGYAHELVDTPGNDPGPDRLRAGRSAH